MSERERETAFLRWIIRHDRTAESHAVEEEIDRLQGQVRVLRRAMVWISGLAALAGIGLLYAVILSSDYPDNMWRFSRQFSVRIPCALELASLVCLLCFMGLGVVYRRQLNVQRQKARRLGEKLLTSQTGAGAGTVSQLLCYSPNEESDSTGGSRDSRGGG